MSLNLEVGRLEKSRDSTLFAGIELGPPRCETQTQSQTQSETLRILSVWTLFCIH
jgi:hypothetical protein